MANFKRRCIVDKYYIIEIFECPTEVIMYAANLGSEYVTIENFRDYRNISMITVNITCDTQTIIPRLKQYEMDFQITKTDFIKLESIWHQNGCYAIFHNTNELKLKVTDLKDIARYKALDNFDWALELAIPSSASDGWGQIASPNKIIIDKIENHIQNYR